mmetsp:Transcript_10494/g.11962  ORF Transcript_10494/g.11962 Transcript_10494/m.11962 type:complete len:130 (+) Transcript_10494:503-892(+)
MRRRGDNSDSTPPEEFSESIRSSLSDSNQDFINQRQAEKLKELEDEENKELKSTENREKITEDNLSETNIHSRNNQIFEDIDEQSEKHTIPIKKINMNMGKSIKSSRIAPEPSLEPTRYQKQFPSPFEM